MRKQRFNSVWDAIEDMPDDAANMKARAELMRAITEYIRSSDMTQAEAAKLLGISQPRIPDLMCGKVDVFSISKLYEMLVTILANEVRKSGNDISGLKVGSGRTNTIAGASEFEHQIDVSLQDGNRIFLIECKRWQDKVGVEEVLVLASRAIDIRDGHPNKSVKAILASTQEVTAGAMNIAKYFDISIETVESASNFGLAIGKYIHVGVQSSAEVGSSAEAEIVKKVVE